MANEITVTTNLAYANTGVTSVTLGITAQTFTISGSNFVQGTQAFTTGAGGTAIGLGGIATLGFYCMKNLDATNYVTVLTAVSGTTFMKIPPGASVLGYFSSAITAPAILANTGTCKVEYLILEV